MEKVKAIFERIKAAENEKGNKDFSYNVDHCVGTEYETLMDYFYYDRLKWCGCGCPEEAQTAIQHFLDAHKDFDHRKGKLKEYFGVESVYDETLLLCFAYTMGSAGFTEHGTSIAGAWLTQDGEDYLYCLELEPEK